MIRRRPASPSVEAMNERPSRSSGASAVKVSVPDIASPSSLTTLGSQPGEHAAPPDKGMVSVRGDEQPVAVRAERGGIETADPVALARQAGDAARVDAVVADESVLTRSIDQHVDLESRPRPPP